MPRSEELFRNEELRVFEGENLLIYRDWNREDNKEEIQFTYDLLGSYLVSRYLVKTYKEYYPLIKYNSDHWFVNTIKTGFEFFIPESGTKLLENCLTACNKKIGTKKPLFKFVKSTEFTQKLLNKDTEHPLFDDILRTICILLIKTNDIFLFNVLQNERAKKYSTESLFEINKKYIEKNEKPIKVFLETEFLNQKIYLLDLAENIELDVKHPLNFNFWSDLLKNLSISERDLSWSEYVRRNHSWYGNSHFSNIVRHFEKVCKDEKILSDRVHVAAKKVMWILTTNIRKLRDESTRALYYYARKYPKEFLDLLKYSIDINDPYVPERMLAVSYGLAMARQNDFKDKSYQQDYLLQYGKWLFDNLFSNEAKYTTTHILARDYAKRTIDIALLHQPDLLTIADKELIKYPLVNYPHTKWKEEKDKNEGEYYDGNAPVQMDFRNYTIGRLINDRKNYDDEHNEYKQVLSQIYWRVYNLGYSLEKFGKIDRQIEKDAWNNSYHDSAGKIDRYGKKYSWIAFYEMAGYRSDLGLLKGWNDKDEFRISDVDIDPSFPIELRQYNLFEDMNNKNFLGNETSAPEEWYEVDDDLVIEEYIAVNNQFGYEEKYDWILLKGNMSQKNKADQTRDAHISINAVLVNEDDYKNVDCIVSQYKDYTFDYLRNDEQHYLYEGEIPWCDLMLEGSSENFVIHYNFHDVKKVKKELKVLNNGKALLEHEVADLKKKEKEYSDELWEKVYQGDWKISVPFIFNKKNDDLTKEIAERIGYSVEYIDVPYYEKAYESLQVNIETTVFENLWESSHSEIISNGETKVPSKNICNHLELFIKAQTSDLYNRDNEIVSTAFKHGNDYDSTSFFTYIRKDYLDKYLKERNKKIIWLQWTEKRYFPNGIKKLSHSAERQKSEYRTYYRIVKL
ncbi:hypothetical protein [Sulfurimonas sp.]|uniref:hypothetical protein n=1 Tax=Sulfurimonas sp. TaxID=2022749 RepID=UPI0025E765D7|nr:hypothetical protein [Sulfurimonas sp.]